MDELSTGLDPDELMDMDEASDIDDDDDDNIIDDPLPSPLQLPSSGPASAATSAASSPPTNDEAAMPPIFSGKPLNIKRGRGRPRREGGKPVQRKSTGIRMKRWKPPGMRGGPKRVKSFDRGDFDFSSITQSPSDEMILDPETGSFFMAEREKPMPPTPEELPYAPEAWPGKVCGFCNLGERSQLGQGEMLRLMCQKGFTPKRVVADQQLQSSIPAIGQMPDGLIGDKSPRGPVTCRRQKSFNKCRNPSMTSEYVDELTIIGFVEEPDVQNLFESTSYFYVHRSCAYWSSSVIKTENMGLDNVGPALLLSSNRKCAHCNHYGASVTCKIDGCSKIYHYPCATASGAFQELGSCSMFCSQHLSQAAIQCEGSVCYTCKLMGDIANLMYCSICGEHYHGTCVGLAQLPGVRAGWQCRKCRNCQTCRITGDETKLMTCEQCDKVYHASCQRPMVTSIPKYGWKCRCCRVCGDCGSRTPGAGLSSRWHSHYTVCDSCYQQRNKGFNCPICHRAYRAHAHREMVQCSSCRKFVHGTCDPEADLLTFHKQKEAQPDYEYVCLMCKNQGRQMLSKRNSIDEDSLSASQESLYDDVSEFDIPYGVEDGFRSMGLGKGKPYACKIAKKKFGYGPGMQGRPKGIGKGMPGKVGFMKKQKMTEFGRKRGSKYKMRGIFGVPGVGLQRPTSDGGKDEEPGIENRLVLCSAKDKYVLTQDICVMCGSIGTDQEGCLIACVQCGQCYHPYCVNVKVTKVILQKGWRCLDCTVCEGCGLRDDESRLLLCDDCDISFHIYCMDPPLHYVPQGNWKCKWCAICQSCGTTDPGFNCNWMNSFSECGPCASHTTCASCIEPYSEGDLIIQCVQCERWLHGACDSIKTEADAEKCAEYGYNCILCRPRDTLPPHLQSRVHAVKPPTPTKSPDMKSNTHYYLDGVFLSESGHNLIKSLSSEQSIPRKKRKKLPTVHDKEAGIMATIESVIAGSASVDNTLEDAKLELVDVKDEPQELYKEGMTWTKEDGPPPEGFTIFTTESGLTILRRKRQRNLQKLGIGGFVVRVRGIRGQDNDDVDTLPGQSDPLGPPTIAETGDNKPRRKTIKRKPKSKLSETFPAYLQEAFFGKELMDSHKDLATSSSEDEQSNLDKEKTIHLSQDEIRAVAAVTAKQEKSIPSDEPSTSGTQNMLEKPGCSKDAVVVPKEEYESDTEALKDVLNLPGDLLDTDLVNTFMNENDEELTKNAESLEGLADSNLADDADITDSLVGGGSNKTKDTKDELNDLLVSGLNLDLPIDDELFKVVLTDESQESQESNIFPSNNIFNTSVNTMPQTAITQHSVPPPVRPSTLATQNNLNSPISFPPQSPYQSEYSNSPQFSPAFSDQPQSPWVNANEQADMDGSSSVGSNYNQKSSQKMKADEGLGQGATISAVLYANIKHPEWKTEYPTWSDRYKQIIKKWRTLTTDQKAPYLQQAKDNRSALRMKKQQQINKESSASSHSTVSKPAVPSPVQQSVQPQPVSEDQEKIAQQQKTAREAENERQWKQLQALRHQQSQQQLNVIQDHRSQVTGTMVRVQRQLSEGNPPQFLQEQLQQAQTSNQEAPQLPHTIDNSQFSQQTHPNVQRTLQQDPYAQQPSTPRPAMVTSRSTSLQGYQQRSDGIEVSHQLRNLLQFNKLDEQILPGKGQQRVWPPNETGGQEQQEQQQQQQQQQQAQQHPIVPATTGDATFRHPLPPGIVRQRPASAATTATVVRQPMGLRMLDPRLQQSMDPRMRLFLQQRGALPTNIQAQMQQQTRIFVPQQQQQSSPQQQQQQSIRQSSAEIEQILQRANVPFQQRPSDIQCGPRMPLVAQQQQRPLMQQTLQQQQAPVTPTAQDSGEQEIPDNVTAELEKLEQEGSMVELQGVGDILGGFADDEDELLAEMGSDFNILEYADPELDALTGGEKTNILDSLDLVEPEPEKDDDKDKNLVSKQQMVVHNPQVQEQKVSLPQQQQPLSQPNLHPPPLVVSQSQTVQHQQLQQQQSQSAQNHQQAVPIQLIPQQQVHQQMLQHVQQAAAMGRPMLPGKKLMSTEDIIGTVTANNNVSLTFSPNYQQKLLQIPQNQKVTQMRLGNIPQNVPRMAAPGILHQQRLPVGGPPPPPPPYSRPPPPYPGSTNQTMGLQQRLPPGLMRPLPHVHRRPTPLLLEEQPLLLEELLEQEKREQEKQMQTQVSSSSSDVTTNASASSMLTEHDLERLLKTDLISNTGPLLSQSLNQGVPAQGILPPQRTTFVQQPAPSGPPPQVVQQWQQQSPRPQSVPTPQPQPQEPRIPPFNAKLLPAPQLPPDQIVTEQDKQIQVAYEKWLNHQNNVLTEQLKYYETEVQKLRKIRKSLNSKQRQLRKSGNQLGEAEAFELQKIQTENNILQKHLETSRKQSRQHGMLIQDYRNKQQAKQGNQMLGHQSPLGPPASSPIHPPQSPMMSPSASPMMQHSSPMHSPAPSVSHSPGPGSVSSVLQSPNNPINQVMSPMQPSPRIGTPHSQNEGSPGPVQSPSMHLPPPMRMTSPQHRRVVTSPIGYSGDLRPGTPQARFARPPLERTRLQSPSPNFQQKPGTPSPLNSPPPQPNLQRHLQHQQPFIQQAADSSDGLSNSQRTLQLIHQRQFILRQQQNQAQQQGAVNQPQPLTAQQHQLMVHQQQQLAKQQQLAHLQAQQRLQQQNQQQNHPPNSPMPPQSPLINQQQQMMSPHSMHSQPPSPMVNFTPTSPMPRSPAVHQSHQPPSSPMIHQPPSPMPRSPMVGPNQSPMQIRRPPSSSNSPAMPDRPTSVENPRTPYNTSTELQNIVQDNDLSGGGNPHNPNNPIPYPPGFGRFGYVKMGLRGGSPIWGTYSRGAKRIPENKDDKVVNSEQQPQPKIKKESHLSKVSILKKKSPAKTAMSMSVNRISSLVSSDYNELDDSSSSPSGTPSPMASTSRLIQKTIGKKIPQEIEPKEQVIVVESNQGKQIQVDEIMDYDDDNDSAVVSTEVSLNSVAQQQDGDDITVIQTFTQSDLTDSLSSPLESEQISNDFLLFDIAENTQYSSDKEDDDDVHYAQHITKNNMHIVDVAIQSPTTSEEELIMQGKTKKVTSDGLTLNIVQGLSPDALLAMESPEPDDMSADTTEEEEHYESRSLVLLDQKMSDEKISTKEDFEELIDEDSRKIISEIHKYAAPHVVSNFPPKTTANLIQTVANLKTTTTSKISLITPLIPNYIPGNSGKKDILITHGNSSAIILPLKTTGRNNIISVPKLVTSVSPAITIVSASTSQMTSMLPSTFTVPVISARAISKLPNVKVIDKPSTSLSLTAHQDTCLPKKIFEDDSVSPDSSNNEDDKKIGSPIELKKLIKDDCKDDSKESADDITKSNSSLLPMHNPPELKMTAQIIQENQGLQIARTVEMPFITTQSIDTMDGHSDDTKSVVISIPSPTPSQEQMLDNIALQALENRRRDGNSISREFESFDDVLDMIENIRDESPSPIAAVLENSKPEKMKEEFEPNLKLEPKPVTTASIICTAVTTTTTASLAPPNRLAVSPQLSPLSQPSELTTNIANVSQQLRILLSETNCVQTTTGTTNSNNDTIVKSITKDKVMPAVLATSTPKSSAEINNSLIIKKAIVNSPKQVQSPITQSTTSTTATTLQSLLPIKTTAGIQLMPDHPKLPPVTTVAASTQATTTQMNRFQVKITNTMASSQVTSTTTAHHQVQRKPSLSLNAMLQSHPAATTPQTSPGTITTASILGSAISITKPSLTSLAHAHPNVMSPLTSQSGYKMTSLTHQLGKFTRGNPTNLLHTHLTKSPMTQRTPAKTNEEDKKEMEVKTESQETTMITSAENVITSSAIKQEPPKYTMAQPSNRMEESQNVLLKQLLQNTACATSQSSSSSNVTTPTQTAPSLPIVPNLEAQLATPVPPTPTSLLPPILQNDSIITSSTQTTKVVQRQPLMSRETSFVSKPVQHSSIINQQQLQQQQQQQQHQQQQLQQQQQQQQQLQQQLQQQQQQQLQQQQQQLQQQQQQQLQHQQLQQQQQLHIDVKKGLPPSRTPSRDDLLSPGTPRSSCSQDSSLQTPPLIIKKEHVPQQSPVLTAQEVKKEFVDESSQHSEISEHSKSETQMKEEMDFMEHNDKMMEKEEMKKLKRRAYQKSRRQNQNVNKEVAGQPKKRSRKSSKLDEDYDSYIESVLGQLRTLPSMVVSEPILNKNFAVVPIFGSGDTTKLGLREYDSRCGDLVGTYGNAVVPGFADFYSSKPYGDEEPLPEKPPASTQRGFYDQEFPLIRFDTDEDKKYDLFCREDSPDSILSSSSLECDMFEPPVKFPGLKLIDEDEDDEEICANMRLSPVVPLIAPIPIRLQPTGPYLKDYADMVMDKENICKEQVNQKPKFTSAPGTPLKDSGNVTVTLTLTSSAAEDIMGVLRDLANILHIPAPTSYQIVERTSTPPSQKLGLYRTKGKDGKEGAPIDIQSILNGAAKFCRHCDVVILNNMIRKKVSELPFLSKDLELLNDGDELFFCSSACYMQFALMHRSPSMSQDKAAEIIDHLCQKDKMDDIKKAAIERPASLVEEVRRIEMEKMDVDDYDLKSCIKSEKMQVDEMKLETSTKWRNIKYKAYTQGCLQPPNKYKKLSDKEIMELMYRLRVTVLPSKIPDDTRKCMFCHNISDSVADGPARLLNIDVDKWVHLNCALWSDGVYETVNGALMNLSNAIQQSLVSTCALCNKSGATIRCFKTRCSNIYHLPCAVKDKCVFYKNKTTFCSSHIQKGEKDNELTTLSVSRRVYVDRDENRQVAAVMHHSDQNNLLRVGSLIFLNVGQLLPHQLTNFHTSNYIYPIGYKIIRFYWSMRRLNKRCRYVCSIHEVGGRPEFRIVVQESDEDDLELRDVSCKLVWMKVLEPLATMRRENQCVQIFPQFVSGEDLFGLTEPAVVRVLESLPGIETLADYKFKYGRNPLLELPLAINPSGAARTEPKLKNQLHWKRPHTQRTGSSARPVFAPANNAAPSGEAACPYSKQFVHSKSSQYKKMKQEWRNNVFLARSKIQGLGLCAARDLEKHTMVIEYIGEIIRTELAETREKKYEAKNRGIYMFRLDEERVVDATLCGGLARYINHSCNPNCVAEIVEVDRDLRIIIFAKRRIQRGEELSYDYKFDIEDDQHKISCMCGAPNCKKWMN